MPKSLEKAAREADSKRKSPVVVKQGKDKLYYVIGRVSKYVYNGFASKKFAQEYANRIRKELSEKAEGDWKPTLTQMEEAQKRKGRAEEKKMPRFLGPSQITYEALRWFALTPKWKLAEALMHLAALVTENVDGYDEAIESGKWFDRAKEEVSLIKE